MSLRTVKQLCILQDNALSIKLSDQVEQLDELINIEGDGSKFFEKTFITNGMKDLVTEATARLASKSNQAVFHLKQAMGGGKTHLLIGLGLLAKNPNLRKKYFPSTPFINDFDTAVIAAFNGRNNPEHFLWGEIATQLGKPELFKQYWVGGPKAPDEKAWLKLFEIDKPILILLDEMPPYFNYYATQPVGQGTVADIITRAFANLLTAASKKSNVCIVISDLTAAYETGGRLINSALEDARKEVGRQERNITPVDLTTPEIYEIIKKRLFKSLPDAETIKQIADTFAKKIDEAIKSKQIPSTAEAIVDEITITYPFHPRLKNLISLFKENEDFKQTRGILELISRLLKSVWERKVDDVYLIGPQHFDLSISEVREKITEISGMRDVISIDIWDEQGNAHAQAIDKENNFDCASQLSTLLLVSSLSTAVNAVKGLTLEEIYECLIDPNRNIIDYQKAFESLDKAAWYLHHTPEGKYYFDRQENLTKLLTTLAKDAPSVQIEELIRSRLDEMFKPIRKNAYQSVLALPKIEDINEIVRKERVLLINSPDFAIPKDELDRFFEGLVQKNNILILTGQKSTFASLDKVARQVYASKKAENRIPKGHPQREELEKKQTLYEQDFNSTILNLFDTLLYPIQISGREPELFTKQLKPRDPSKPFDGELQIEETLTSNPPKLYLDIEKDFDTLRIKAENSLWLINQDETRWNDILDRYKENPAMPWLPLKGLEKLKDLAIQKGKWEDLGNGYITKRPKKKKTSIQIIEMAELGDDGFVQLKLIPQNVGQFYSIHYAEDGEVNENSPTIQDDILRTNALKVKFLVIDKTGNFETGDPVEWKNKLKIRNELFEENSKRKVKLYVAPKGNLKYTLDGSEPKYGIDYTNEPIEINDSDVIMRVYAFYEDFDATETFRFPPKTKDGIIIDYNSPATLTTFNKAFTMSSREITYRCLELAKEMNVSFEELTLNYGNSPKTITLIFGQLPIKANALEKILNEFEMIYSETDKNYNPASNLSLSFKKAHFSSGMDLKTFCEKLNINLKQENILQ